MARFTSPLNNIKVASPCSANWEEMYGTERRRMCGQCNMNVYNLSAMTRDEAERLIINTEGRLCARFYRRPDGTILTKDCPVGWKAAKQRVRKIWSAAAGLILTFLAGIGIVSLFSRQETPQVMGELVIEKPVVPVEKPNDIEPTMGAVAYDPGAEMGDVSYSDVVGRVSVDRPTK